MNSKKCALNLLKILGWIVGGVVVLFVAAVIILNIAKFFIYKDYFSYRDKVAKIPELSTGWIPQGISYCEEKNGLIATGYMGDGSPSRLYFISLNDGTYERYDLFSEGKPYTGHTGGIQYDRGTIYLASDGIYRFPLSSLDGSEKVEIGVSEKPVHATSFVFCDDWLWTGEFHRDGTSYICKDDVTFNGKTNHAILCKYAKDDLSKPLAVYSIPQNAQGFAITEEGNFVISTSWGPGDSHYLVYGPEAILNTYGTYNDAPLYFLDEPSAIMKGTCMSEDLDLYDGKVMTIFECASNKYVLGKFFFGAKIIAIDIDGWMKQR